jgi:hypothetical protein
MPFNKQFAFIFTSNISDDKLLARTISHEIAHGTFDLRHTFSTKNTYTLPEGQTDNLMDYPTTTNPATATSLNKYQWDLIHYPNKEWFSWLESEEEGAIKTCFNLIELLANIRKANIEGKDELNLQLYSCYNEYLYDKLKLDKNEFIGIKVLINGYNRLLDSKDDISMYSIKPSELFKTSYYNIKSKSTFIKYQFHELKNDMNNVPYDKKETTGPVRIEIDIREEESKNFEEYLYPQEIIINNIPYLSQLDTADTRIKTGCTTGCCWAASCWMINQTGTQINHNSRIYFADPINVDNLADGIITIISEKEFNDAILYIKNQLQLNQPVLCGTWDNSDIEFYKKNKVGPKAWNDKLVGENNSATTHFMVIMGYGYDKTLEKFYFSFYNPEQSNYPQGIKIINYILTKII